MNRAKFLILTLGLLLAPVLCWAAEPKAKESIANEDDLVSGISKVLPSGWSVTISSVQGKCLVEITTARMETQASMYGNSYPGVDKKRLGVSMQVLPRYTPAMLERIKKQNQPIREKLEALGGRQYSDRQRELESQLIDEPMFHDGNYGFKVSYPSRVPARPDDARMLMDVLEHATSDWKSYDADKPKVLDELRRILTH